MTKTDVMESVGDAYSSLGTLNTGKNRIEGIELSLAGAVTGSLSVQLSAAFMDSEVLEAFDAEDEGLALSNFADDSVYVQLRYQATEIFAIGGSYTYKSEMYGGQPDTAAGYSQSTGEYSIVVPPYRVVDLFMNYYPTDTINLRLNVSNVAGEEYWTAAYRSGSFMYLGDARSIRATLTWAFDILDPVVTCLSDFEALARDALPPATYAHIAGGSAAGQTVDANIAALKKFRIVSRVLVDCREGSTRVSLMGEAFAHPVLLAPVSYQRLVHPDGEIATAQAADALDTGMIVSTLASYPLEAVAEVLPRNKWFQLYLQARWDDTITLVRRTESAGYKALIVTVDAPVTGMRNQAERAGFTKPADVVAANLPASRDVGQIALDPGQSRVFQGRNVACTHLGGHTPLARCDRLADHLERGVECCGCP